MNNKGKLKRFAKLRRTLPALCIGAAAVIGVIGARSFVKAQSSFPRDTQFVARRNDQPSRSDALDDIKDRLYQQSERIARIDDRVAVTERSIARVEEMKLDVLMDRQLVMEQRAKDDAVERNALRTLLITTSVSFAVVLFSSWWTKRNSVAK